MKKITIFSILLIAIFAFGKIELAWADPCTSPNLCLNSEECASGKTATGACSTAGTICCSEKKSITTTPTASSATGTGIQVPTTTGLPSGDIMSVLQKVLDWLEGVFLTLSLIAFVIVGLMYLFSLGNANSSAHTNAKAYLNQAITALLIVGGSYILITTIDFLLQG